MSDMQDEKQESNSSSSSSSSLLLDSMQALIQIERDLTLALQEVEPWTSFARSGRRSNSSTGGATRVVRPLPTSLDEAVQILAVARSLSGRTSAPAGWNSSAPVMGFATPNPLPHQLRGGVLGNLELERAQSSLLRAKKRPRATTTIKDMTTKKKKKDETTQETNESKTATVEKMNVDATDQEEEAKEAKDPKRRELHQYEHKLEKESQLDISKSVRNEQEKTRRPSQQPSLVADMNLSDDDSSSSSASSSVDESD